MLEERNTEDIDAVLLFQPGDSMKNLLLKGVDENLVLGSGSFYVDMGCSVPEYFPVASQRAGFYGLVIIDVIY